MKKTNQSPVGTSYHNCTITATVNELKAILGEPVHSENDGEDKVNFEWNMETNEGDVFTVYDWKEYRKISEDEKINWHIGGKSGGITIQAQAELATALTTPVKETEPAPTPTSKEGLEDGGFTKGDWKIVPISDCCLTVQVDGFREDKKGGYIAEIKWERAAGGIRKEDEANARLIAESKNMMEIVKQVKFWFDNESTYPPFTAGYRIAQKAKAILTRINKD